MACEISISSSWNAKYGDLFNPSGKDGLCASTVFDEKQTIISKQILKPKNTFKKSNHQKPIDKLFLDICTMFTNVA